MGRSLRLGSALGRSLRIGAIRGIDVRIHLTFPLILIWAAFNWGFDSFWGWGGALYGVVLVLLLFGCVVLHELGHSMVAMHFGAKVKDITLLPIGGMAQLKRMPGKPDQELLVALAGPAVNVIIAIVLGAAIWVLSRGHLPPTFRVIRLAMRPGLNGVLYYLFLSNAGMALFNLVPAFPMDGGRVLRALLTMGLGNMRGTVVAVRAGQVVAAGFIALAIYLVSPVLLLVGMFVFLGAGQELHGARQRMILDRITAGQVIDPVPIPPLSPEQPLGSVTQLAIFHRDPDFPVMREGRLVGLLHARDLNAAMREHGPWAPVSMAMQTLPVAAKASDSLYDVQRLLDEYEADMATINDDNGFFRGVITSQRIAAVWAAGLRS